MGELVSRQREATAASIPRGAPKRPIVVIVGMHRSGTSLCASALELLGIDMADEAGANPSNPKGHFERWDIVAIQDEVLALFDRNYYSATHDFPLPPGWWGDLRVRPLLERLKEALVPVLARSDRVGFKDPRTTRLLPMWHRVFADLGLEPRFVVCLRSPAHIAQSLYTRDGLDQATGELRTLDYMVDALRYTRDYDRCFLHYADWLPDPVPNARKLLALTGIPAPVSGRDLEIALDHLVRPELNRSGQREMAARQPLIRHFYSLAQRFSKDDDADGRLAAQIDEFTDQYVAFRQLLGPYEQKLAQTQTEFRNAIDSHVATIAERERRINDLGGALERAQLTVGEVTRAGEAAEAEWRGQIERLDQGLSEQQREIGELRDAVAQEQAARLVDQKQHAGERDTLLAQLGAARASLIRRDQEVAELGNALHQREGAHRAAFDDWTSERDNLQRLCEGLGGQIELRDGQIAELQSQLNMVRSEHIEATRLWEQERGSLHQQLADLTARLFDRDQEARSLSQRVDNAEAALAAARAQSEADRAFHGTQLSDLSSKVATLDSQLEAAVAERDERLSEHQRALEKKMELKLKEELNAAQRRLDEALQQKMRGDMRLAEAGAALENAEAARRDKEDELRFLSERLAEADVMRRELLSSRQELSALRADYTMLEERNSTLQEDLINSHSSIGLLTQAHDKAIADRGSMADNVAILSSQVEATQRHLAAAGESMATADGMSHLRGSLNEAIASEGRALARLDTAERRIRVLIDDCAAAWRKYGEIAAVVHRSGADSSHDVSPRAPERHSIDPVTDSQFRATLLLLDGVDALGAPGGGSDTTAAQGVSLIVPPVDEDGRTSVAAVDDALRSAPSDIVILQSVGECRNSDWLAGLIEVFEYHPMAVAAIGTVVGRDERVAWSGVGLSQSGALVPSWEGASIDDYAVSSADLVDLLVPGFLALDRRLYIDLGGFDPSSESFEQALVAFSIKARMASFELRRAPRALCRINELSILQPESIAAKALPEALAARARSVERRRPRLLVVNPTALKPDSDAGSVDTYWCMRIFQSLGYDVTFMAMYESGHAGRYTEELRRQGILCPTAPRIESVQRYIEESGRDFDVILLNRVVVACYLVDLIRHNAPSVKIIFHTQDLHFLREERQALHQASEETMRQAAATKYEELRCIATADASIVVSTLERDIVIETLPTAPIYLVPVMHPSPGRLAPMEGRSGAIFVGGFSHQPNVDAVHYICREIWPHVRPRLPDATLTIIGSNVTPEVTALTDESLGIRVVGFVEDLTPYYQAARMNVAPLRFGAGIKGKVIAAMLVGLPTVASAIASEGMGVLDGEHMLIADAAADFVDAIVRLYQDDDLWRGMSDRSLDYAQSQFSVEAQVPRMQRILANLGLPH